MARLIVVGNELTNIAEAKKAPHPGDACKSFTLLLEQRELASGAVTRENAVLITTTAVLSFERAGRFEGSVAMGFQSLHWPV